MREFANYGILLILCQLFLFIFMKKFLVLPLIFVMSSCSLFNKTPQTFEDYYSRNVSSTIDSLDKTMNTLGFFKSIKTTGVFDALVSVPVLFSGSLSTDYTLESTWRNASLALNKFGFQYDGLTGTGMIASDLVHLISHNGDLYMQYKNLKDFGISTDDIRAVFSRFDGKWLSWTQADARREVMTTEEQQALEIADSLQKMNLDKIKEYLVKYPVWKSTEDLGMSGGLQMYRVELDKDKIVALADTVNKDLTGSGFSEEDRSLLRSNLETLNIWGIIGFHPTNPDVSFLNISLKNTTDQSLSSILIESGEKNSHFVVTDTTNGNVTISGSLTHDVPKMDLIVTLTQSGSELGKVAGYIDTENKRFKEVSLDITAQWVTATFKHTQKEDGVFDGKLVLPVGSFTWNGAIADKTLSALQVQWVSPMGNIDMNLTSSGNMVSGPLSVKTDAEEIFHANIWLLARNDAFRFIIDIPNGAGTTDTMHGEVGLTMNHETFGGTIDSPSDAVPLQDMLTELDKLSSDTVSPPQWINTTDSTIQNIDEKDTLTPQ